MAREVIMPALGMAQETGLIVTWLKAPGDAVTKGEPLMEVETDKAVMEVEAQASGYLTEIRFGAGAEVPVGEVVAMIGAERPEAAAAPASAPAAGPAEDRTEPAATAPPAASGPGAAVPATPAAVAPAPAPAASGTAPAPAPLPAPMTAPLAAPAAAGRVLASPKARRIAEEEGLDLARLAALGQPQPFHVADLDTLRRLAAQPGAGRADRLSAAAPRAALDAFRALHAGETGQPLDPAVLWAAFAAAALRASGAAPGGPIRIAVENPLTGRRALFADPDRLRLAAVTAEAAGDAALTLRDLTGTRLTGMQLGTDVVPVLTVADGPGGHVLTLELPEGAMPLPAAMALLLGVADRIAEPLRHLL